MSTKKDLLTDIQMPDPAAMGKAILNAYQQAQPLFEEYAAKYSPAKALEGPDNVNLDPMNVKQAYLDFMDNIAQNPQKCLELQGEYMQDWFALWQNSISKFMGQDASVETFAELKSDKRFRSPEWQENALCDFIKNSYLLTCEHVEKTINSAEDLDEAQKSKLQFQTKMITDALSPTNFAMTNPDVIKETMRTGGENLTKGFENLIKDLKRGKGNLNISMTQYDAFELGKNIAVTPGRVVYQNDMMQLIQYAPKTEKVLKTPMLIVPPWINKFYILDLRAGNSYIEWLVEQGHTVFVISWVNPDESMSGKRFEDYMFDGVIEAIDQVKDITKEKQVNTMAYCIGGTLLATTLAYLTKKKKIDSIASATFLTTMLDFEKCGEIKVFIDEDQISNTEEKMAKTGYMEGKDLKKAFTALRANDLVWSFVINNYLMGKEPFPFDLLYWNDDSTNMPATMHSFYLRKMYLENKLIEPNGITIDGVGIDFSKVSVPCHFISTKDDHIAPWVATYDSAMKLGGDVTFTLAGSGHIAGIINPPAKKKYGYWSNPKNSKKPEEWLKGTTESQGSWWPMWHKWVKKHSGENVTARKPKKGIEAAPGSYVTVKR